MFRPFDKGHDFTPRAWKSSLCCFTLDNSIPIWVRGVVINRQPCSKDINSLFFWLLLFEILPQCPRIGNLSFLILVFGSYYVMLSVGSAAWCPWRRTIRTPVMPNCDIVIIFLSIRSGQYFISSCWIRTSQVHLLLLAFWKRCLEDNWKVFLPFR